MTNRAKRLCSPSKLPKELATIRKFASYNGFPKWITRKVIKEGLQPRRDIVNEQETEELDTLHMFLPYNGREAESIVTRCKKKLARLFKNDRKVKFNIHFQSTKVSFFTSNKDRIPFLSNSGVIYRYTCPGCNSAYVGKHHVQQNQATWLDPT